MSIILDALRGGRGKRPTGPNENSAQTDAVLQTLGYGRFSPTTPVDRLKRVLGLVAIGAVLAVALWFAVFWLTRTFLPPAETVATNRAPAATTTPTPAPTPVPVEQSATAASTSAPSSQTAAADRPIASAFAPSSQTATADRPTAPPVTVHPSQRVGIPTSVPAAPAGAPSRSVGSTAKGASTATVISGEDHFGRAMMYQRLGDFENALVSYREVLQRDDLNVEAHNNLGVLYRDKGLFEDAIRHFQRAIAISPGYARARNNLGVVYLSQRRLELAATQFHAALAIDARNVESMVNLSTVERESGRRDQARSWLTRALDIDARNAEAHYNLGLMEDEAGSLAQALAHYRVFLQYGAATHPALVGDVRKRITEIESRN